MSSRTGIEEKTRNRLVRSWFGRAGVIIVTIAAAYFTTIYTLTNISRTSNPAFALRMVGDDSRAMERLAEARLESSIKDRKWDKAKSLAQAAIENDPTSSRAVRILAMIADVERDHRRAEALLGFADFLSRRDLGVRLYFIERSVLRNDVAGALHHFDIALRTSNTAFDLLVPILAKAMSDSRLVEPIAKMMNPDPAWLPRFLNEVILTVPSPVNLARIMLSAKESETVKQRGMIQQMLLRLVKDQEYRAAEAYFVRAGLDNRAGRGLVRDSDFTGKSDYFPFQWAFVLDPDLGAEVAQTTSDQGLRYYASTGKGGEIAKQLLILRPGRYFIASRGGNSSADPFAKPVWVVRCATGKGTRLVELPFPSAPNAVRIQQNFTVPVGCDAQWIYLELRASQEQRGLEGYIHYVQIAPSDSADP